MLGLMQEQELLISTLIRHAATHHGRREIVSRAGDGHVHRTNYARVERRSRQLALALESAGIKQGDRVATLATSTFRHLECFYGVSGMGAVLHTVNPRLFKEQLVYIINHAEDRVLLFDPEFLSIVESIAADLPTVERLIVLSAPQEMPKSSHLPLLCYETLLASADDSYEWPVFDERTASSLCYTSGTTGNPKGVLYSHRSTLIHAFSVSQADGFAVGSRDAVMPIAPMFHANAWSLPYGCAMTGAKLVLPGPRLDPASLHGLIEDEGVTFAVGVPTIWTMLIAYLHEHGKNFGKLNRCLVAGTAMPPAVRAALLNEFGVRAIHAWGMTETSPIGTYSTPTAEVAALPEAEQQAELLKQGRVPFGIDMKVVGPDGKLLPKDGVAFGSLCVRGPWVASGYFKGDGGQVLDSDGWFPTGDVATWDDYGYMKITDRTKDVIKSGGEWISSIEIENLAMSHPKVLLAAAVAAYHPKWDERPVLVIVPAEGEAPTRGEILEFLSPRMAKWSLPDDVVFISEMPMTATGKVLKAKLRTQYWKHIAEPPG